MSNTRGRMPRPTSACMRLAFYLTLCAALSGLSGCRTRSFLSTRDEVNIGKEGSRQIEQELPVEVTGSDSERVRRVGQKVLAALGKDRRDVPYAFKVLDAPEINAVSLPGGPVYVFKGLLDMLGDDDDALACILGHEIGHVNGRHAARNISSQMATQLLILFGIPNPAIQQGAGLAADLLSLKYSRDDEFDADRRGVSYAHFAGYDPNGIVRFFEKMDRLEKRYGSGGPEWLRTHPLSEARIQKAETIIEGQNFRFGGSNP